MAARIRGTFQSFLERENFHSLIPLLQFTFANFLYGSFAAVGALYGLMWFTPALVYALAMQNNGPEPYGLHMVDAGYQSVLQRIVEQEGLRVEFNSFVVGLKHVGNDDASIELEIWRGSGAEAHRAACGFVVWTGPASQLLRSYPGVSDTEATLLSTGGGAPDYLTSSVVSVSPVAGRSDLAYSIYLEGLANWRPTGGVLLDYTADKEVRLEPVSLACLIFMKFKNYNPIFNFLGGKEANARPNRLPEVSNLLRDSKLFICFLNFKKILYSENLQLNFSVFT